MNYNEDTLAKKIAEEQLKTQLNWHEKRRIKCWRIALKGTTIITGIITLPLLFIPELSSTMLKYFLIILAITIWYCKKHPKKDLK